MEKLVQGAESGCPSEKEKQMVLNCTRILTRILPYIFEDQDWRGFFWSTVPGAGRAGVSDEWMNNWVDLPLHERTSAQSSIKPSLASFAFEH